ncbi:hypothetical protein CHARACLAT_013768 [Characodon lateralis]|uniref:Uncharacterized protein n=1 Tax=Characodon lateralis TaxID=208331 RepID=A0ABU7CMZ8_9TELE|nr:hypothetical protein [Characodon lateralis]
MSFWQTGSARHDSAAATAGWNDATAELLVETLNQLSPEEFKEFKTLVQLETGSVLTSSSRSRAGNM